MAQRAVRRRPPRAAPAPGDDREAEFAENFEAILVNVMEAIQGKREVAHAALVCMLAKGHLLIEDVPGVGKTSLAKAIARSLGATSHRIQFTPDLLPSDVTGGNIWNRATNTFEFHPGGVFANIVLADEINRASPKTQAALLEAMEERQVTIDSSTHHLDEPFMVIATQNPIELEGTYALPEAQLDRFLMRLGMGYPDRDAEMQILDTHAAGPHVDDLGPVVGLEQLRSMLGRVGKVHVDPSLKGYIVDLVAATRLADSLLLGVSPRGALALQRAARAHAAALGRDYVTPDDVKTLAVPVLAHRVILAPHARLSGVRGEEVIEDLLASVPVPRGRRRPR